MSSAGQEGEYVTYNKWLRELGLLSLNRISKILLLSTSTKEEGAEKRKLDSSQRCTATTVEAMDTSWGMGNSY